MKVSVIKDDKIYDTNGKIIRIFFKRLKKEKKRANPNTIRIAVRYNRFASTQMHYNGFADLERKQFPNG